MENIYNIYCIKQMLDTASQCTESNQDSIESTWIKLSHIKNECRFELNHHIKQRDLQISVDLMF